MVKVKEIMKRNVITVDPTLTVSDAAKIMTNNRIGSVIVLDEKMKPIDIVTDDDIVGLIAAGKNPKSISIKEIPTTRKLIAVSPDDDSHQGVAVATGKLMASWNEVTILHTDGECSGTPIWAHGAGKGGRE